MEQLEEVLLNVGHGHAQAVQLLLQHLVAAGDVLISLLALEPLAYLAAGVAGVDVTEVGVEPVAGRAPGRFGVHDFYDVTVVQLRVEGHQPAVHFGAYTHVAQVGMDSVSEVMTGKSSKGP